MRIRLSVNESKVTVDVEPNKLLVEILREELELTGTKIGCETSVCGSCTVLVDGSTAKSCTMLAPQVANSEVVTIEGLTPDEGLSPLQQSFSTEHGLQCGFCTPGMVVSATALLAESDNPTDSEIRHAIEGNLCRCTGYGSIVRAIRRAAAVSRGDEPLPIAGSRIEKPIAEGEYRDQVHPGEDIEVV